MMLFTRRRLPHWIPDAAAIFVTWRLAGSMPAAEPELLGFAERDRKLDHADSGPVWLKDPHTARMVVEALRYGEGARGFYSLHAFVVMPNHVHAIFEPHVPLPAIMRWLKGRTGRRANQVFGRTGMPFWQDESYDHWIRSGAELSAAIRYVERNPVTAGLVGNAEDWPWSSAFSRADDTNRSSAPQAL